MFWFAVVIYLVLELLVVTGLMFEWSVVPQCSVQDSTLHIQLTTDCSLWRVLAPFSGPSYRALANFYEIWVSQFWALGIM